MKYYVTTITIVLLLSSCCVNKPRIANTARQPDLEQVVELIQRQYTKAIDSLNKLRITDIEITEASISLKVTKAVSGSGEIKVLIFKPSVKVIRMSSTSITYTLSKDKSEKGGVMSKPEDNTLRDLIVSTAQKFSSLHTTIGELTKGNFELDLSFSIEYDLSGGLSFEVWGLGVDASLEKDHTVEHEMVLTFGVKPQTK